MAANTLNRFYFPTSGEESQFNTPYTSPSTPPSFSPPHPLESHSLDFSRPTCENTQHIPNKANIPLIVTKLFAEKNWCWLFMEHGGHISSFYERILNSKSLIKINPSLAEHSLPFLRIYKLKYTR